MNRLIERIERIFGIAPAPVAKSAPTVTVGRSTGPARGYSLLELKRAGLSRERAEQLGLRIDPDRPSSFGNNVMQLQKIVQNS